MGKWTASFCMADPALQWLGNGPFSYFSLYISIPQVSLTDKI